MNDDISIAACYYVQVSALNYTQYLNKQINVLEHSYDDTYSNRYVNTHTHSHTYIHRYIQRQIGRQIDRYIDRQIPKNDNKQYTDNTSKI